MSNLEVITQFTSTMKRTLFLLFISGFLNVCYAQEVNNNYSKQIKASKEINLYPNPASNYFSVVGITTEENFVLYNILGKDVLRGKIKNNERINISNFKQGVYLLRLESGKSFKLMKE